ncbi:MAG: 3-oxoacyl-ACP synthase [Oligoflexus sp.]|nr:3-oxoacyl-ACP synthase [Oligoflexus sp.]
MEVPPPFDLEAITGIQQVHTASKDEDSFTLALAAAKDCLSRSRYKPEDIDVIIIGSITRFTGGALRNFTFEPPLSHSIKYALGAPQAMHFDVSNACAGMFTGVFLLDRMIRAGTVRNGLVISGDFITPIAETAIREIVGATDPQFGSMTVGDSGAAVIIDKAVDDEDCIDYYEIMSCAEYSQLCLGMPSDKSEGMALYTINAEMHKKDRIQLWPRFQLAYYQKNGRHITTEKFDHILHHQVGSRAISNASKYGSEIFEAELPKSSLSVVEHCGNTATTAHFVTLYHALKDKTVKKGDKVLIVPAASGLITGFLSATFSNLKV